MAATEEYKVMSAYNVPEQALLDFYEITYPQRFKLLALNWEWLYQTEKLNKQTPLVTVKNGRVIVHAGLIPENFKLNNKQVLAQWFVDFAVLPEFQRQGLGVEITRKWMSFLNYQITFCNPHSLGVFKKMGWEEGAKTYDHVFSLFPANQRPIVKKAGSFLRGLILGLTGNYMFPYHKFGSKQLVELKTPDKNNIAVFYTNPANGAVHDEDYFNWRILKSPLAKLYKVASFSNSGLKAILKLDTGTGLISVLALSDASNPDAVLNFIAQICLWGMKAGYLNVRFLTSDSKLSATLKHNLKGSLGEPIFAFYSPQPTIMSELRNARFSWQLIDSDFDLL
jgi:hypothetical protein